MSNGETEPTGDSAALFERRPWGRGDLIALLVWTAAIAVFFWDSVSLRRALFYFDITEINYPYRAFFADELRAGRFSRWCPGLYCGMPLFSESQAGYLHPLKYLLYPWLADLAGVQPRHGALGLADRRGDVLLAAAARRAGGGTHRGRHLRRERLCLGPSDPHQHDQCPGQRAVCDLGTGKLVGERTMARSCARWSGPGVPGLRRPSARRAC